jgi:hypothetical protein
MTRVLAALFLAGVMVVSTSGCCSVTPMNGTLFVDLKGPVAGGSAATGSKVGEAKAMGILGVVTGDCSIETAMKNGNITKIHHVDNKVKNILGIYAEYITTVYGE